MELEQQEMKKEGKMVKSEAETEVNKVIYFNQLGTPHMPLMEIACVPEKEDLVYILIKAKDIKICPDKINPFWEQSVEEIDKSSETTN